MRWTHVSNRQGTHRRRARDRHLDGQSISVKGPKGELSRTYSELISVRQDGEELVVERSGDDRDSRAQHGLVRSLIQNMVTGVTQGFQKDLEIVGVGYRAQAKGQGLELSLGFSHPVVVDAPDGILTSRRRPASRSTDLQQLVGQVAANIREVQAGALQGRAAPTSMSAKMLASM